jgi:para-nitrobenzyl esterase
VELPGLGLLQGIRSFEDNHVIDFFGGIPYAAPPVGSFRFSPPQQVPKWAPLVLDASQYGTDCYQIVDPVMNPLAHPDQMSEDCLYLNVFTPAGAAAAASSNTKTLLPVMVWFHGGAFQQGGFRKGET